LGIAIELVTGLCAPTTGIFKFNKEILCQHPAPSAAGLRALKLKLADQSKSISGLRFLSDDTHECVASSWPCRLLLNSFTRGKAVQQT